jgi:HAD superfamily hydrolase (TIGR01509 family)
VSGRAIDALLFDLGGVLLEIDFVRVTRRWAELAGVDEQRIAARFTHGEAYERHERGEIEAPEYFAALRRELGIGLTDAQLEEGWNRVFVDSIAPTVALLQPLAARLPLHVFSNTNRTHHRHWAQHYARALAPIGRRFLSFEMGSRKPERESFEHVARELDVPLERILFFDDTAANVAGAQAVGMPAVRVRSPADVARAVAPWLG